MTHQELNKEKSSPQTGTLRNQGESSWAYRVTNKTTEPTYSPCELKKVGPGLQMRTLMLVICIVASPCVGSYNVPPPSMHKEPFTRECNDCCRDLVNRKSWWDCSMHDLLSPIRERRRQVWHAHNGPRTGCFGVFGLLIIGVPFGFWRESEDL